jgi:hypothetical protein
VERHVGAPVEKEPDHVGPVVVSGPVERIPAVETDCIDRGTGLDQRLEHLPLSPYPGPVERGVFELIPGRDAVGELPQVMLHGEQVSAFGRIDDAVSEGTTLSQQRDQQNGGENREPSHD